MEKRILTLPEVKAIYGDKCNETATAFTINKFGKYQPNLTFVVSNDFTFKETAERPFDPLEYFAADVITSSMNLDFDGTPTVLFGDFWFSKAGKPHFRVKEPRESKGILVKVAWGGAFNSSRGRRKEELVSIVGIKYFHRAASNGGGAGCDYYVVPIGYKRLIWDEEIDGPRPDHLEDRVDPSIVIDHKTRGQKYFDSAREYYLKYGH